MAPEYQELLQDIESCRDEPEILKLLRRQVQRLKERKFEIELTEDVVSYQELDQLAEHLIFEKLDVFGKRTEVYKRGMIGCALGTFNSRGLVKGYLDYKQIPRTTLHYARKQVEKRCCAKRHSAEVMNSIIEKLKLKIMTFVTQEDSR